MRWHTYIKANNSAECAMLTQDRDIKLPQLIQKFNFSRSKHHLTLTLTMVQLPCQFCWPTLFCHTLRAENFARPFRGFKFREFYFLKKIYGKNFRDFLKIFIFNFREWLGKMNKYHLKSFFFLIVSFSIKKKEIALMMEK